MASISSEERSTAPITERDLARFAKVAVEGHRKRRTNRPDLANRLVAACLAQGAAAHYLDPAVGLKDLDLWLFYDTTGHPTLGPRVIVNLDLGPSKFGRHPADPVRYVGR